MSANLNIVDDMSARPQHVRFSSAPWYSTKLDGQRHILIGGAGGIGSWTTLLLARAGFFPIVCDFDLLEEHNLGGQLYPGGALGAKKTDALITLVQNFADVTIMVLENKYDFTSPTEKHIIAAFDNMEARQAMFKNWIEVYGSNPEAIYIDGRLTAEQMQIFCIRGGSSSDIKGWQHLYEKEYLFDDSEVEDAPCTMKQTSHAAAMIASHIVGFFTNHITNIKEKQDLRTVPFYWEYFIPMDLLDVNR